MHGQAPADDNDPALGSGAGCLLSIERITQETPWFRRRSFGGIRHGGWAKRQGDDE
jgi:hypothetical protein